MTREPLLTVDQCARRLTFSHSQVRGLIGSGKLPASKIGNQWRIESSDLEAFITSARPVQPEPVSADPELKPESASRYV